MSHGRSRQVGGGFRGWVARQWQKLPQGIRFPLEDAVQPESLEERLLPYEEVQLVIQMAWYRDILGILILDNFDWTVGVTLLASVIVFVLTFFYQYEWFFVLIPLGILLIVIVLAFYEWLEFRQWRLVRTNGRFIISMPDHQRGWPYVDNIDLKNLPNVIDTNLSPHPIWRIFQVWTGARDLSISLSGYKFIEGTARVSDPITFPDVMPEQIYELRKLVFGPSPPGKPQKVQFETPQKVIVMPPEDKK